MNTKTKDLLKRIYIGVVLLGIAAAIFIAIEMDDYRSAIMGYFIVYAVLIVWICYSKRQIRIYNRMETAIATVTGYREVSDSDDSDNYRMMYQPRLEFTVQGQVCSTCLWASSDKRYKIGEKINIRYHPDDPSKEASKDNGYDDGFWINGLRVLLLLVATHAIAFARLPLSDAGYILEWLPLVLVGGILAAIGFGIIYVRSRFKLFVRIPAVIFGGMLLVSGIGTLFGGIVLIISNVAAQ